MSREDSRWTYTLGSRPEGVIIYDSDSKIHVHHDTCPARGQHNSWDLVRLMRFGHLDTDAGELPIADRPSSRAMVAFAESRPEIRLQRTGAELDDLGPLPEVTAELITDESGNTVERFKVYQAGEFTAGQPMDWVVRGMLPRAELAVIYGESGSGKSFLALDLCAAITRGIDWRSKRTAPGRVVYVCAEGAGGFKARLRAYSRGHGVELGQLPAVISDAPNLLEPKDAAAVITAIVNWAKELDEKETK